jgi:hypothetical protein
VSLRTPAGAWPVLARFAWSAASAVIFLTVPRTAAAPPSPASSRSSSWSSFRFGSAARTAGANERAEHPYPPRPAWGRAPAHLAVEGVDPSVHNHESVCLLGPSRRGKTTLLNMAAGLDRDFEGGIHTHWHAEQRLAYMFRTPALPPWRTVIETWFWPWEAARKRLNWPARRSLR